MVILVIHMSLHVALPISFQTPFSPGACGSSAVSELAWWWRCAAIQVSGGTQTVAQSQTATARVSHRSEEHTSELQSPCNLVCRRLLEKKKINHIHKQ